MNITLIRHGQSQSNVKLVNRTSHPDHLIDLTPHGIEQAIERGKAIGPEALKTSLIYCSPYLRTRKTLQNICVGAEVDITTLRVYEDPLLREMEFGYEEKEDQLRMRQKFGWFYYRYRDGESPADVYNRCSIFIDTMFRQSARKSNKNIIIISHGLTIRVFAMRFLHLTVEQFDSMDNIENCGTVIIGPATDKSLFRTSRWGVEGLRLRKK